MMETAFWLYKMLQSSAIEGGLRVLVHGKLAQSQQCPGSQESQPCPGGHQAQHHRWAREGIVLLCSEVGQPHLQCWGQLWVPQYKKDIKLLESVQRRAAKMLKGLEGKLNEQQLRSLGLCSL